MNYLQFFLSNSRILIFVVLMCFFSGFGQTFLLSVYIPDFINDFDISRTGFSSLYSIATLLSGISIIFAGKLIDKYPVKIFAIVVIVGLTIANITAGLATNVVGLFLAIFLLRFFGQGLATHTSFTIAGKYYNKNRGKALSIAYLGFPFTEGIMPGVVLFSILAYGWRDTFFFSAAAVLLLLLPLSFLLLRNFGNYKIPKSEQSDERTYQTSENKKISQKTLLRMPKFYLIALSPFLVGFIITALFFFQTFIAESKGWSVEWMAVSISSYALSSFVFSILSGPLIDRFSAVRIFPFIILPIIAGFALLHYFDNQYFALAYWFFIGITAGVNSTVSTALYAEIWGISKLGMIRSLFTFIMIIGTALGPVFYSSMLDFGFSFSFINMIVGIIIILNFILILSGKFLKSERV